MFQLTEYIHNGTYVHSIFRIQRKTVYPDPQSTLHLPQQTPQGGRKEDEFGARDGNVA
jgi:hypothetical protein